MSAVDTAEAQSYALNGSDTARILSRALAGRVRVTLRAELGGRAIAVGGPLQDARGNVLIVGLEGANADKRERMTEGILLATFELEGVSYAFDTRAMENGLMGKSATLQVEAPKSMAAADRRLAPRRRLKKTSGVVLHAPEIDPGWWCEGILLNVSTDGLACRVSEEARSSLTAGMNVRAVFRLASSASQFDLGARVATVTQAAEPEQLIVGLEFLSSAAAAPDRARLGTAVDAATAGNC